jgi:hypothetical protein
MIRTTRTLGVLSLAFLAAGFEQPAQAAGGGRPPQGPILIRVRNPGTKDRYLQWEMNLRTDPACAVKRGGIWKPCQLFIPFCVDECSRPGAPAGCRECSKPPPMVWVVPAGKDIVLPWEGRLYPTETRGRHCTCFRPTPPPAGRYRFTVCAYRQLSCHSSPRGCPRARREGVMLNQSPQGQPECASAELDLPSKQPELVLDLPR